MQSSKDLTKGNISRQMWSVAWPMMLSVFFHTLYNIVDAYWVSKLSADAIAAVSISQITLFLMMSLGLGVTVGSGVLMAMELGAHKVEKAEKVLGQSFVIMVILGLLFSTLALIFKDQLLTFSGAAGDIFPLAKDYFTITSGGSIFFFVLIAIMFAFNSQGDTFTLTKLFALSTLVNLILDPMLIFGWGPLPEMGISGAAIATLISQFIFIVIALRSLSSPKRTVQFHFKNLGFDFQSVKQVMKIGFPAALTQVLNPIGLAALNNIVSKNYMEPGTVAISLGFRIEFFAYLPAIGYGFAAMAMIGQSIGAHDINRAKKILKKAIQYGSGIALALGLTIFIFAPHIVAVFTDEPQVVDYTLLYYRTVSLSYFFLALTMIEANAFQSIGRSWPGFWISFLRLIVITVPLAYLFSFVLNYSIVAVWGAIVVGNVVAALIGYVWISKTMNTYTFKEVDVAMKEA